MSKISWRLVSFIGKENGEQDQGFHGISWVFYKEHHLCQPPAKCVPILQQGRIKIPAAVDVSKSSISRENKVLKTKSSSVGTSPDKETGSVRGEKTSCQTTVKQQVF